MTRRHLGRLVAVWVAVLALCAVNWPAIAQRIVPPNGAAIELEVDKGTLIRLERNADTVFIANPDIADVKVKSPKLIYVHAKKPGETSLYAVDEQERVLFNRPVIVRRDVERLRQSLRQLLPNSTVDLLPVDGVLVLTGSVNTALEAEEARRLARPFVNDDNELISRIRVEAPNQVNLRVRVAEVSRNVIRELGINWDSIGRVGSFAFGLATGLPATNLPFFVAPQPGSPGATAFRPRNPSADGSISNSGMFGFNNRNFDVNAVLDALDQNGLVTVLAEPNLTAMTGETASFLAGGEFPIVVGTNINQVSIEFKPFGVALAFTPVVLDSGRISLRVRPEVSQLSSLGAVEIQGFSIPALTTRRAETTVELGSGQSFAIGGLLQNNITDTLRSMPGLGDIPVLGALFRSNRFQRNETELVILVTPYLVRPISEPGLVSPPDGVTPPNTVNFSIRGPSEPNTGAAPLAPPSTPASLGSGQLIGPAGFILN